MLAYFLRSAGVAGCLEGISPATSYCVGSSSSNISESAAPAGTIGKTLASGAQSNTSSSGSGDRKKSVDLIPGLTRNRKLPHRVLVQRKL